MQADGLRFKVCYCKELFVKCNTIVGVEGIVVVVQQEVEEMVVVWLLQLYTM